MSAKIKNICQTSETMKYLKHVYEPIFLAFDRYEVDMPAEKTYQASTRMLMMVMMMKVGLALKISSTKLFQTTLVT